jgi:hypothetical protein
MEYSKIRLGTIPSFTASVTYAFLTINLKIMIFILCAINSTQTGSGAHAASYTIGIGNTSRGGKNVRGVKLTTYLRLVPKSKMLEL